MNIVCLHTQDPPHQAQAATYRYLLIVENTVHLLRSSATGTDAELLQRYPVAGMFAHPLLSQFGQAASLIWENQIPLRPYLARNLPHNAIWTCIPAGKVLVVPYNDHAPVDPKVRRARGWHTVNAGQEVFNHLLELGSLLEEGERVARINFMAEVVPLPDTYFINRGGILVPCAAP